MKQLIFIAVLFVAFSTAKAQSTKPKQHIYYDTVKTVTERLDYAPDTIPVYFKEIVFNRMIGASNHYDNLSQDGIKDTVIFERWVKGFVIWQTYKKRYGVTIFSTGTLSFSDTSNYYKGDFQSTKFTDNQFLYADRKTKVKNRVLYTILR